MGVKGLAMQIALLLEKKQYRPSFALVFAAVKQLVAETNTWVHTPVPVEDSWIYQPIESRVSQVERKIKGAESVSKQVWQDEVRYCKPYVCMYVMHGTPEDVLMHYINLYWTDYRLGGSLTAKKGRLELPDGFTQADLAASMTVCLKQWDSMFVPEREAGGKESLVLAMDLKLVIILNGNQFELEHTDTDHGKELESEILDHSNNLIQWMDNFIEACR